MRLPSLWSELFPGLPVNQDYITSESVSHLYDLIPHSILVQPVVEDLSVPA